MKKIFSIYSAYVTALFFVAAFVIAFGGPRNPPPMPSVNDPFKAVSFKDLPSLNSFVARDGTHLAYRFYPAATGIVRGSVVLVHGSSGMSSGMHMLAKTFSVAGYASYALDIRGHGNSGERGKIGYIGELEDDLEDFLINVKPPYPMTLAGFSSGGGFALRFAGSSRQKLFSNYLLLTPFISQDAPTNRANSGGWVSVGVPRWFVIGFLDAIGVKIFNDLPVIRFALDEQRKTQLTSRYSFTLAQNFRPERDYRANIRAAKQPMSIVAGANDEIFKTDELEHLFKAEGQYISVSLIPGVGHIALTLDPVAIQAAVSAVNRLNQPPT